MKLRRTHPRGDVIAYIWIGVFVAGFLLALFFQDDDPNTDEGAGAGALIFIAGLVLTVAYLALRKPLNARTTAVVGDEEDDISPAAPDTRRWARRNRGPLGAGAAAIAVIAIASVFVPPPETVAQSTESPAQGSDPAPAPTKAALAATVRAAARAQKIGRPITSVDCIEPVDTSEIFLFGCAVTFEGPACQLWLAGGMDDPEPMALSAPTDGRRGWADEHMAHCE